MKNGKVRIYDLSKELSLENKDVLEICSQLSIEVKTHSSTITEVEAQSIRDASQNYRMTSTHNNIKKNSHNQNKPVKKSQSPELKQNSKKPEILALHKHNRLENSADSSGILAEKPQLLSPPPRPNSDATQSDLENGNPSPSNDHVVADSVSIKNTGANLSVSQSKIVDLRTPPLRPKIEEEQTPSSSKESQPQSTQQKLVKPPTLPNKESQNTNNSQETRSTDNEFSKPKPKPSRESERNNNQRKKNKNRPRNGDKPSITSVSTVTPITSLTSSDSNQSSKPINKPQIIQEGIDVSNSAEFKLTSKPKLQNPPQRPVKSIEPELDLDDDLEEKPKSDDLEEDFESDVVVLLEKPKRVKQKQKKTDDTDDNKWDDDDDSPNGKKSAKKRRPVIIDDDDLDDLFDEDDDGSAMISMAIARPQREVDEQKSLAPRSRDVKKQKPKLEKSEIKANNNKVKPEKQTVPEFIILTQSLTVRELADRLNTPDTDIIKMLFFKGIAVNITETLDMEIATMMANELGVEVITEEERASAVKTKMLADSDMGQLQHRPPVVTIMGHVDHGKTTLLDSIRNTKVVQGEAGGITQHIGAYHVDVEHEGNTQQVVFLDTPGHEAFTAMRARGAKVTDIAVLVVAADDGVRPQTREAISHARAAKVPIVVAINKVDKPDANPDRVKQELAELELVPEDWGGDTIMVPVSALTGENLDTLLEMIVLQSEVEELSANPDRLAKGTVIEAHLDRARGPVATLLVQNGTLRVGDIIVAGSVAGRIRAMIDDRGDKVEEATPSFAVEVLGLNEVPAAGDEFDVYDNEKEARAIAEERAEVLRNNRLQQALSSRRVTLSSISAQAQQGELKELNLILKGDVQGSIEAILGSLKQLPQKEVQIRVLLAGAGEITETDVDLAAASGAVVIGFNTTLAPNARQAAEREAVDIREYNVIYKLLDEIQGAMEGLLDPEEVEESLGVAQVRAVFSVGKGAVAGCYVQSGKVVRNRFIRVLRDSKIIYNGNLDSLRRVKEDVKEVASGFECGIGVDKFADWQEGDRIEAYEMVFKRRTLSQ